MKKISENERALFAAIWKYAELLLDENNFAKASEYVSPATEDKDAFLELCNEAGIPENIPGFGQNLHEYLWMCAKAVPPINMMW